MLSKLTSLLPLFLVLSSNPSMASSPSNVNTSPNVKELLPRIGNQAAQANIYSANSATPGLPDKAWFIEIIFTGDWPDASGIKPILESRFGGAGRIIMFTSDTNKEARFYAPGFLGTIIKYWDNEVSASIKEFANSGVSVTPQYPGI